MTTQDIQALDTELNTMIQNGNALEAFEKFYADTVVMQENEQTPTAGKAANREREKAFFASVSELRKIEVVASATQGNTSFSQWFTDYTHKDNGGMAYHQVAVRTWENGKVVKEVFYYG